MSTTMTFTSGGIFASSRFDGAERIVERRHESAALQIQDGIANAIFAPARRTGRFPASPLGKFAGRKQPRLMREEVQNLPAVPDVIAAA